VLVLHVATAVDDRLRVVPLLRGAPLLTVTPSFLEHGSILD
jgi:hypothetical protein